MSRTPLVLKCASMVLAVGLSLPTCSGTASAEGELGHGDEWADSAYINSPDNDWLSESQLSAMLTVMRNLWAQQSTDPEILRLSIAEREALMAEVDAEMRIAAARGAGELEVEAAQVQAAADLASGAVGRTAGTSSPKGASPGSSTKGGPTDSSTSRSSGGSSPSP